MYDQLLALTLATTLSHRAIHSEATAFDQQTLETVLVLAGLDRAAPPVTLTSAVPAAASSSVEGWTSYGVDGQPDRIFVYSRSDIFRCASWPLAMYQCRVRLASVLVHEAWHFRYGRSEVDAYEAQIAFLMRNRAAIEHIKAVRLAQKRVAASERRGHAPPR